MSDPTNGLGRASFMRRYGALVVLIVVAVVVAGIVVLGSSSAKKADTTTTTQAAPSSAVVSWSAAKAAGTTSKIAWGSRCNTATGHLAYPSSFASECYAPFTGDNGGATAQGVTATEIKVVLYLSQENDPVLNYITSAIHDTATNAQTIATMQNWVAFYNHYFETYGRKVVLVPFVATGAANDAVAARADAVTIATNIKPFAVWGGPPLTTAFADELAARHVLTINGGAGNSYQYFESHAPYLYTLSMLPQQNYTHTVNFLSRQVAGRKASFAGSADLRSRTRKFGLITLTDTPQAAQENATLLSMFKKAKVPVVSLVTYASPLDLQTSAPSLMAHLKAAGATSIIFSGDPIAPQLLTRAASAQNYFPEWIITGVTLDDLNAFARTYDQSQWRHAFGVTALPVRVGTTANGYISLYTWYYGQNPPDMTGASTSVGPATMFFPALQGIGPDLTVANFQRVVFGSAPTPHGITQASYSWGNHGIWPATDYAGADDMTEIWWNPDVRGPDELGRMGQGMYEFVDGGKRYEPSQWPSVPTAAFQKSGADAVLPKPPANETPPPYPSPHATPVS